MKVFADIEVSDAVTVRAVLILELPALGHGLYWLNEPYVDRGAGGRVEAVSFINGVQFFHRTVADGLAHVLRAGAFVLPEVARSCMAAEGERSALPKSSTLVAYMRAPNGLTEPADA